jgi:transcriptional regulator with XRE-family HTH domain
MQLEDAVALENIARNFARVRGDKTYSEIARAVGTYPANISDIEKGKHMPGAALLARIADELGVTVDYLLTNGTDRKPRRVG